MSERNLLLAVSAFGLIWWAAFRDADRWDGFVYPDRNDLTTHFLAGQHKTLEGCRLAANAMLTRLHARNGDYECGLNCKSQGAGPAICESTER